MTSEPLDGVVMNGHKSLSWSPSIKELAGALIKAQAELSPAPKDKENPFFHSSYAGLDTVMPLALKALNAHGLGVVQSIGNDANGGTTLSTTLLHESGEWLSDTQPLLLVKPEPQGQGSAVTYARRYAIMALIGMVAEADDDGNAACAPQKRSRAPQRPQSPAPERTMSDPRPPPPPARPDAGAQGTTITTPQMNYIRKKLGDLFGKDEQRQCEFLDTTVPLDTPRTEVHLSGLTKQQASTIIDALNKKGAPA